MWSFIKGLFGSSKNTETIVSTAAKGIYNGLDALAFTDQEKAELKQKAGDQVLKFAQIAYDQNSIRSITRRWLAFVVVGPAMFNVLLASVFYTVAPFVQKFSELQQPIYNPFDIAADNLVSIISIIAPWAGGVLIFYFGPHILSMLPGKRGE